MILLVALGGAVGAAARYVVDSLLPDAGPDHVPRGTSAVNLSGSLLAGVVGTLWTHVGHPAFFLLLATLAVLAAAMLWRLDRPIRRHIHP